MLQSTTTRGLGVAALVLGAMIPGETRPASGAPVEASVRITRLTFTDAGNGQPFWSPDASRISFVSNRSGSWQVWTMAADGSDARQLTDHPEPVGWPSWHPHGERILFYAGSSSRPYRLYWIDASGGEPELVFAEEDGVSSFRPSVSPNGRQLLLDRWGASGSESPHHDLYLLDLRTVGLTRLTLDPGYDSDARWSPDGSRIVFHSDRGGEPHHTQIYVMDADGGGLRALTRGAAKNSYPAWAPDGHRIVYTSETDGNPELWMIDADDNGAEATRLTHHPGKDSEAAWAPDGRILFSTARFGDGSSEELALMVLDAEASSPEKR